MKRKLFFAGTAAGCITGILGTGGGLIFLPILSFGKSLHNSFALSVSVMLPICITALIAQVPSLFPPLSSTWPYLIGGGLGGTAAAFFSHRIPAEWLHRIFGVILLWGGIRFLCS